MIPKNSIQKIHKKVNRKTSKTKSSNGSTKTKLSNRKHKVNFKNVYIYKFNKNEPVINVAKIPVMRKI